MTARGRSGALKEGYRVVARLGTWAIDAGRLTAEAADVNAFALEHGTGIDVELDVGPKRWRWRNVTVVGTGPIAVTLPGRPEVG